MKSFRYIYNVSKTNLPDSDESRAWGDLVTERVADLSCSKRQVALVELEQPLEVHENSLSGFRSQKSEQHTTLAWIRVIKMRFFYPLISPDGPIIVANIRLNSIGSVRSLPVSGDLMLYFCRTAFISSFFIPSSYIRQSILIYNCPQWKILNFTLTTISSQSALVSAVAFLSAATFSSCALIKWSSRKHSPDLMSFTMRSANRSTWPEALKFEIRFLGFEFLLCRT